MKEPKEKIKRHDRTQNNKQMDDIYIIYYTLRSEIKVFYSTFK